AFCEVARNHYVVRAEIQFEVAKRGAPDVRIGTACTCRSQCGTFVVDRVVVEVSSERDVERPSGLQDDERIKRDSPQRTQISRQPDTMPDIARSTSVLGAEVVGICRETSRTVSVAVGLTQNVISIERAYATETAAHVHDELILVVAPARLVLKNVAAS